MDKKNHLNDCSTTLDTEITKNHLQKTFFKVGKDYTPQSRAAQTPLAISSPHMVSGLQVQTKATQRQAQVSLLPLPSEDANNSCMISSATSSATAADCSPCVLMKA